MSGISPVVLVVDDEEAAVRLLQVNLSRRGYQAITALNGEQALHLLRNHPVDLVLLDITMPGLDGITVCRRMQMISRVPVLMVSARAEERYKTAALAAGATDYIVKPFDWTNLMQRIESAPMGPDRP